jgi:hypothetical protein
MRPDIALQSRPSPEVGGWLDQDAYLMMGLELVEELYDEEERVNDSLLNASNVNSRPMSATDSRVGVSHEDEFGQSLKRTFGEPQDRV